MLDFSGFFLLGDMWNRVSDTDTNLRTDNRRWGFCFKQCFGITVWIPLRRYFRTLLSRGK